LKNRSIRRSILHHWTWKWTRNINILLLLSVVILSLDKGDNYNIAVIGAIFWFLLLVNITVIYVVVDKIKFFLDTKSLSINMRKDKVLSLNGFDNPIPYSFDMKQSDIRGLSNFPMSDAEEHFLSSDHGEYLFRCKRSDVILGFHDKRLESIKRPEKFHIWERMSLEEEMS